MHADLDLLCVSVYCTADDLLPAHTANARRKLIDAEIVTLCVAQVLMGILAQQTSCSCWTRRRSSAGRSLETIRPRPSAAHSLLRSRNRQLHRLTPWHQPSRPSRR
jgi:hypothetical protein